MARDEDERDVGESRQVIAKVTVHRRVDNKLEHINPGTPFTPQSQEEFRELRKAGALYESREEQDQFLKASEGIVRHGKPGIVSHDIAPTLLRQEAAHRADLRIGADSIGLTDAEIAERTAAERRMPSEDLGARAIAKSRAARAR